MKQKPRSKLKLPLRQRNQQSSTARPAPMLSVAIDMPLTSSWNRIVPNAACRSARPWWSDTGCILSHANSPQVRSTFGRDR
jgi:hypothetical protein